VQPHRYRTRPHPHLHTIDPCAGASSGNGAGTPTGGDMERYNVPHLPFLTPPHLRKGKGGRQPAADPRLVRSARSLVFAACIAACFMFVCLRCRLPTELCRALHDAPPAAPPPPPSPPTCASGPIHRPQACPPHHGQSPQRRQVQDEAEERGAGVHGCRGALRRPRVAQGDKETCGSSRGLGTPELAPTITVPAAAALQAALHAPLLPILTF
jgi:hypothetical protein